MAHGRNSPIMIMALGYSQVSFRSVMLVMVCVVRCSQGRRHGTAGALLAIDVTHLHRFLFFSSLKRGSWLKFIQANRIHVLSIGFMFSRLCPVFNNNVPQTDSSFPNKDFEKVHSPTKTSKRAGIYFMHRASTAPGMRSIQNDIVPRKGTKVMKIRSKVTQN